MTKEEVLELEAYCISSGASKREALQHFNVTEWNYYNSKRKLGMSPPLRSSADKPESPGVFIPVILEKNSQLAAKPKRRARRENELAKGNVLTIEMRTSNGTELRIQGQMNISMLREILHSSSTEVRDV